MIFLNIFFFQAEDGIRDRTVTGVQTCALPILIGLPVTVITACQPEGRVQLLGERWKAHCTAGAAVGDRVVIEAVEQITLEIGRASCRERVSIAEGAEQCKKQTRIKRSRL